MPDPGRWRFLSGILAALSLASTSHDALAQANDARELRLLYGGQFSASYAKHDDGYFNQLEYVASALRWVRASLQLELRASPRFAVLSDVRADNFERVEVYALYARVRPWRDYPLDVQAGRIPPVFGAFARRRYDVDNPLIGLPLLYHYPTTTRADAAPATLGELESRRGFGAKTVYSVGDGEVATGLSVMSPLRWDTGVQIRVGDQPLRASVSLTQGTLSRPRVRDDNPGKQLSARVRLEPALGWVFGVSAARGRYDAEPLRDALVELDRARALHQTAVGVDVEFSRGALVLRGESIWNRWDSALVDARLESLGAFVEARYKLAPGFYAAARADYLGFARAGSGEGFTWDAPVTRVEGGVGYSWHRHLLTKLTLQHNRRDGGPRRSESFVSVQAVLWF